MTIPLDRRLRRRLADSIEAVFGPDPGLIRLRTATRAVLSAIVAIALAVALFGGSKAMAPVFAAGFMVSVFGNIAVQDSAIGARLVSLLLLALTMTAAMAVTGALAAHPRIADTVVFVICVVASAMRSLGQRGTAIGMVAFLGSFLGDFLHVALAMVLRVLAGALIAAGAVAVLRLWLIRDDPAALLAHVRRHLDRRISRILGAARDLVGAGGPASDTLTEPVEHRINRELARLNDAFLVAQHELNDLGQPDGGKAQLSWDRLFALELAAERLVRVAAHHGGSADRERACGLLDRLNAALLGGARLPDRLTNAQGPLLRAIDALIAALDRNAPASAAAPVDTVGLG